MRGLLLTVSVLASAIAFAQPQGPDTLWTRTFGVAIETAYDVLSTPSGEIVISGEYWNPPTFDLYARKLDSSGNEIWFHTYGDPARDDWGGYLANDPNGGYALAGSPNYYEADEPYALFHLNADGDTLQAHNYFYPSWNVLLQRISEKVNGDVLLIGTTWTGAGHPLLVETRANGDTTWTRLLPTIYSPWMGGGRPTPDGGWIVVGAGTFDDGPNPMEDIVLIKLDSLGTVQFVQHYGNIRREKGSDVAVMPDGGFTIAGWTQPTDTLRSWAGWVIRTTAQGDTLWTRVFDQYVTEELHRVLACSDGGVIVSGLARDTSVHAYLTLTRLSADGEMVWRSAYPAGDWWFSESGLAVDDQSRYILTCSRDVSSAYVLLTAPDPVEAADPSRQAIPQEILLTAYPNPFNSSTEIRFALPHEENISLKLYDLLGKEVKILVSGRRPAGSHRVWCDGSDLPSGMYFYQLKADRFLQTRKMVLLK